MMLARNFPVRLAATLCACFAIIACPPAGAQGPLLPAETPAYGPPMPDPSAPQLQIALSRPVYTIRHDPKTGAPRMPKDVVAKAEVVNWPLGEPKPVTFLWRVYLDWDFPPFPTSHSIKARLFAKPSPFTVDFGEEARGGALTVVAKTYLDGKEVFGKARAVVVGENPPRSLVLRAFPASRFGFIASKIATAESGLRQFTSPAGLPLVSRTNDVGMMQLNAPSGAVNAADQIWDWRANVQRGLAMFRSKQRNSFLASRHAVGLRRVETDVSVQLAYLNLARLFLGLPPLPPPTVTPLSDAPGSGIHPQDTDSDRLALSQWERDAIRRYNGGSEYAFVVTPDPLTLEIQAAGWQLDPTRGGIRMNSGDPNYVANVLRARSGMAWPPPAPKQTIKKNKTRRPSSRKARH